MTFVSEAQVETLKASRYLKALCNHFSHKVTASYNDNHGTVQFGIGNCLMEANDQTLRFSIEADNAENFDRVKHVIADHLERFSGEDALKVQWNDRVTSEDNI